MFSHMFIGTNDVDKSKGFYDSVMGALGVGPGVPDDKGRFLWLSPTGVFGVGKPINGQAACHANGGTIGFAAQSAEQVDAWHAAGVAAGGASCEDPPGIRHMGPLDLYLAYLRDPDGNKLCAMYRAA